jgi:hypothetical protein
VAGSGLSVDTAFVVVSCDKYSDLWQPFFRCLRKYWPDCPFPQFLVTNHQRAEIEGVEVLAVGPDTSYSDNIRAAMSSIPQEWVILWLDDVFLSAGVDSARLVALLASARKDGAGFLKLSADMPMSYTDDFLAEIGPLPKGIRYRAAIGCGWYKKDTLLKLLVPGASAWELDRSGVCDALDEPFYALTPMGARCPPFAYAHLLVKGRWLLDALPFLRREGLEELRKTRQPQSLASYLYGKGYHFRLFLYRAFRVYWR